jgi:small-conductance mechanosensitive channel
MIKKLINLLSLIGIGLALFFVDLKYPDDSLKKGYVTVITASVFYLFLKVLLDELVVRKVQTSKTRYSLRKVTSMFFLVFLLVVILRIWLPNAQALLVSYGLIAAGVAIALQDFFKNIVGGIILFITGTYRVGDRIELNGKFGDVIDIGIFYTSLLEIGEWVAGDQATGRILTIPNGLVLSQNINHYTKDHDFIWDEIMLPISYKSNWEKAIVLIREIVINETKELTKNAEKEFTALEKRYYVSRRNVEPNVYMMPTDNWITLYIRYISDVRKRRILHNKLVQLILKAVQKNSDITIASTTMEIVGLPKINLKK